MEEMEERTPERRFDMKRPCVNCPFRTDGKAIRFAGRERAEEIEESAYRHGFPCHTTAEYVEHGDSGEHDGFEFGDGSQHCIGYIIMCFKHGYDTWPGIGNDEELADRLQGQVDWQAPVFDSTEEFFEANSKPRKGDPNPATATDGETDGEPQHHHEALQQGGHRNMAL